MDYHHRTGFGPEITEDDLNAAGRAELARMSVKFDGLPFLSLI
jgi:hypothetical protein